jgi:hypothetical protein
MAWKRRVPRQFIPGKQSKRGAARVEEGDRLAGCLEFSGKAERFVKRDTGAHVADAERDHGQSRDRLRRLLVHRIFPAPERFPAKWVPVRIAIKFTQIA